MSKGSIAERLATIERQLAGRRITMSKQERDASVAAALASLASQERALAALMLDDDRRRAAIAAAFRADG